MSNASTYQTDSRRFYQIAKAKRAASRIAQAPKEWCA
jgi:hypothetical protein